MFCTTSSFPVIARTEGAAELASDVLVVCGGGDAGKLESTDIQVFTNFPITSQVLTGKTTDALLLVNDQLLGAEEGGVNVLHGTQASANSVRFLNVPFTAPGLSSPIQFRITNLRVDLTALEGASRNEKVEFVLGFVTTSGETPLPIDNPIEIIAVAKSSPPMDVRSCDGSSPGDVNLFAVTPPNPQLAQGRSSQAAVQFNVRFTEGFASAFKTRIATGLQSQPGSVSNTESGLVLSESDPTGQASQGTRMIARFAGVPDGVQVYVTTRAFDPGGASSSTIEADLINADAGGRGGFQPTSATAVGTCAATGATGPMAPIPVVNGVATAVWEITSADPFSLERLSFGVALASVSPQPAALLVSGNLGPITPLPAPPVDGTGLAPLTPAFPVPRFADISNGQTVLTQTGLTFTARSGGSAPHPQQFGVGTDGQEPLSFTVTTSTTDGQDWLKATPASGASDGRGVPLIQVTASPDGLAPGNYYGRIEVVSSPLTPRGQSLVNTNTVRVMTVVFQVLEPQQAPAPTVEPSGVILTATAPSAVLQITNLSAQPLTFHASSSAPWIRVMQHAVVAAPNSTVAAELSADPSLISPGVNQGTVVFQFSDGSSRSVSVRAILPSGGPLSSPVRRRVADAGVGSDCSPTQLIPVFTLVGSPNDSAVGWPIPIAVQVADDCGNAVPAGNVQLQFSNNDPPLTMTSVQNGQWTATWKTARPSSNVTIAATASIPNPALEGHEQYNTGVAPNTDPPTLDTIRSVGPPSDDGPLAPGQQIVIRGSQLADRFQQQGNLPLPFDVDGTEVFIGGRLAPILESAGDHLVALLPFDLPVDAQYELTVLKGSRISTPAPLRVVAARPSVFTTVPDSTQGEIRLASSGGLANASSPAHSGDTIRIRGTGLGTAIRGTDFFLQTETGAPDNPPASITVSPQPLRVISITIGGVPAFVTAANLVPGATGVYEITTAVPKGVAAGDAIPVIVSVNGFDSPPVTMAIR